MTASPDISGHSEKSCNSSLLMTRIKLILREAFSHDSSQSPVHIEEVAQQLKEAYRKKPRDFGRNIIPLSVEKTPSEATTIKHFHQANRFSIAETNNNIEEEKEDNIR